MDHHIKDFYSTPSEGSPSGNFHTVIALHEAPDIDWKLLHEQVPKLCRGWFELAQLNSKDRIEFSRDFWLAKFSYHPKLPAFIVAFFESLDDIGIFISQQKFDDPFEIHMVYSLKEDKGFFRGGQPASDEEIASLQSHFPDFILPADYLAFLQIHNGFSKTTDSTGIKTIEEMKETYDQFQAMLVNQKVTTTKGKEVNPRALIPFYESFGMPFYQCFWEEWYPENEMGNVYFSGTSRTISDTSNVLNVEDLESEFMAFPTFTDWLMFYLEQIG